MTIKLRRGTTTQWTAANPILADGEQGYDRTTKQVRVGDATNHWLDLDFFAPFSSIQSLLAASGRLSDAVLATVYASKSVQTVVETGRLSVLNLVDTINAQIASSQIVTKIGATAGMIPVYDAASGKYLPAAVSTLLVNPIPVRFSADIPTIGTTGSDRCVGTRTITAAYMRCGVAPTGSSLTAVVQHWDVETTTWSDIATLNIVSGALTESIVTGLSQAQTNGDLIRLNVTSVGVTSAAQDVVVDVVVA